MEIEIKVGKEEQNIPYSVGVKQGDIMAPELFPFLMQAMKEALEGEWSKNKIDVPAQFRHFEKMNGGRHLGQSWKTKGKLFKFITSCT